jgi:RHS repeat-associated protein
LGTTANGVNRLKLNYTYGTTSNNGNVLTQTITVPTIGTAAGYTATQSYSYDELNRLKDAKEVNGTSETWKQTYLYDRYGNRTFDSANTTNGYVSSTLTINPANNRYNPNQGQILYDAAGNLTRDFTGHTFAYNGENHQVSYDGGATIAGGASYGYDGDGRGVKKVVGGTTIKTTIFVYNAMGQLVAEYDDFSQEGAGGTSYLTSDTLGSPRVITDSSGAVKARHDYLPFGDEIGQVGGRTEQQKYIVDDVNQKFTQKERDSETGLDYFGARYYSSTQGRFTSPDPLLSSGRHGLPQTWNRYIYTLNNPLRFVDPSGLYEVEDGADPDDIAIFESALSGIRTARDKYKVGSKEYNRLSGILELYGKKGDKGVLVKFSSAIDGAKATRPSYKTNGKRITEHGPLTILVNTNSKNLALGVAHEGQHVVDFKVALDAGKISLSRLNDSNNLTRFEVEDRGYESEQFVARKLDMVMGGQFNFKVGGSDIFYMYNPVWEEKPDQKPWTEVDEKALVGKMKDAREIFLRDAPEYQLTRKDPGERIISPK